MGGAHPVVPGHERERARPVNDVTKPVKDKTESLGGMRYLRMQS
jgi:hypothetical protein